MKDYNWIKENLISHRGLHDENIPENSLMAFQNAAANGYDIELDVQLTKDNQMVVIHDNNLSRLCGIEIDIRKALYDDIKDLKLNDSSSKIPLLKDILDTLPNSTHLMIELKSSKNNKVFVSLFLELISKYTFRYVVQSFDPRIIHILKRKAPTIYRGYILKNKQLPCTLLNWIIQLFPLHSIIKPNFYVYKFDDLPNKKMDKMKRKGYPVLSYTAKSQQDLEFIKSKYDNAVFEGFHPNKK